MKKINLIILIAVTVIISSCGMEAGGDYKASYKDQPLQGKIGGKRWMSETGKVSLTKRDSVETWSFDFTDKRDEEYPCNYPQYEIGKVMFTTKNVALEEKQLRMGFDFAKNLTITLVYDQDSAKGPMNKVAVSGAYEITEVDTGAGQFIKGRMDIYVDDNNFVNGNFIAKYCPN